MCVRERERESVCVGESLVEHLLEHAEYLLERESERERGSECVRERVCVCLCL